MGLRRPLDFDQAREVGRQLDGAREVVERVQVVGCILGQELNIIKVLTTADQLGDGWPAALYASPECWLAFVEEGPQAIFAHSLASLRDTREVVSGCDRYHRSQLDRPRACDGWSHRGCRAGIPRRADRTAAKGGPPAVW